MEQRHLLLVDEQSQETRLQRIAKNLHKEGIELIYKEIDPSVYVLRQNDGDIVFDKEAFTQDLASVPFIQHLDIFATDYNLIDEQLKGIDVIKIFDGINPYYNKRVVIYSAQIESVIKDILTREDETFDNQISKLKLLSRYDVDYLKSEDHFENIFKGLIEKEPNITIDGRLIESMRSIDSNKIACAIPTYDDMTLPEVANLMMSQEDRSVKLRKEITDHIMACITKFENYD